MEEEFTEDFQSSSELTEESSVTSNEFKDRSAFLCWGCGEFGQNGHGMVSNITFAESHLQTFDNVDVKFMDCGSSHTVIVTENDEIFTWGNNSSGQLGNGSTQASTRPVQIQIEKNGKIAGISCGGRHSMIWLENGQVYSFGNNFYAQLGYDFENKTYKENQLFPHLMMFMSHLTVQQVTCGDKHSLFLFQDGCIASVGSNLNGQIGSGDNMEAVIPKLIDTDQPIKSIASGANHNLAITDDGDVLMWGYAKSCGQRRRDILSPEKVAIQHEVIQVACGTSHSMALTASGNVYTWGSGIDGQLGHSKMLFVESPKRLPHPDLYHNTAYISCGESISVAITKNGVLFMWGKTSDVDSNNKSSKKQLEPVAINNNNFTQLRQIQCGGWHAVALTGMPGVFDINSEEGDSSSVDSYDSSDVLVDGVIRPDTTQKPIIQNEIKDEFCTEELVEVAKPPISFIHPAPKQTIGEFYKQDVRKIDTCTEVEMSKHNITAEKNVIPSLGRHKSINAVKSSAVATNFALQVEHVSVQNTPKADVTYNSKLSEKSKVFYFVEFCGSQNNNLILCSPENTKNGLDHVSNDQTDLLKLFDFSKYHQKYPSCNDTNVNKIQMETPLHYPQTIEPSDHHTSIVCGKQQEQLLHQNHLTNVKHVERKTKADTKISLNFHPKNTDKLATDYSSYREKSLISQTILNLNHVNDIKLKTVFEQLLKPGNKPSKISEGNRKELDVLLKSVIPGHLIQQPATDTPKVNRSEYFGVNSTNIDKKPPILPRKQALPGPFSSNGKIKENTFIKNHQKQNSWSFPFNRSEQLAQYHKESFRIYTKHGPQVPKVSSVSSWQRRKTVPLLLKSSLQRNNSKESNDNDLYNSKPEKSGKQLTLIANQTEEIYTQDNISHTFKPPSKSLSENTKRGNNAQKRK